MVGRECQNLIQNLGEITRSRHNKFNNTVFHLEPNVKDGPGGLRDYNVANWLALISAMEEIESLARTRSTLLPVSSAPCAPMPRSISRCRCVAFCTIAMVAMTTR